jgi:hypothetical protein
VTRSAAYQAGLRRRRERTLARLTEDLAKLWQPPGRGRKRYGSRQELERTALAQRGEELVGLNPASRTQSTARPTTERVLDAFSSITLTSIEVEGGRYRHVTPLDATQRHVLALLKLPADLYERLARPPTNSNFVLHLRE